MIERCGASAISVHGRRRDEKSNYPLRLNEIREVAQYLSIPVLANGYSSKIFTYKDIEKFQVECDASGVLLARSALIHPSIFCSKGVLSMHCEIKNFLNKCIEFDESFTNTKYVVQRLLGSAQEFDPMGRATVVTSNNFEIYRIWQLDKKYLEFQNQIYPNLNKIESFCPNPFEYEFIDGINVFNKLSFSPLCSGKDTPKCILNAYCDEKKIPRPNYKIEKCFTDGRFKATITVDNKQFRSNSAQINKKMAEQVGALAALIGLEQKYRLSKNYDDNFFYN